MSDTPLVIAYGGGTNSTAMLIGMHQREITPDLIDRAIHMEEVAANAGNLNVIAGLGRHWKWSDVVKADEDQLKLIPDAPEIPCMCFDGETEDDLEGWDV